jgi:hypothetical protein
MYILPDAREAYRHWWEGQVATYALWYAYRHLNIPALNYMPRIPRRRSYWGRRWMAPWDISTSGESRFVQNGYPRKTKNQVREDWRAHKQFTRDKAKYERRSGCPPWLKRQCNQDYRAWVRNCIKRGDYDKIHIKTRKDFFDPWMWD